MTREEKIKEFAELLESNQLEQLKLSKFDCETNRYDCKVKIVTGNKYVRVNVGNSGKYMIDKKGNIFGIKGYGVIHKGQHYGTLDTINDYYWGNYRAQKKNN